MRSSLVLLALACAAGCGSPSADRYAAPAYRAAAEELRGRFGPGVRLWLAPGPGGGPERTDDFALVRSATGLPVPPDSLRPAPGQDVLLRFGPLAPADDGTVRLRVRSTVPLEPGGDTPRFDDLAWLLTLRCGPRSCLVAGAEVVERTLLGAAPGGKGGERPAA